MNISEGMIGDVVVFDCEGRCTREDPPRPAWAELVKARLEEGKKKVLFNLEKAEIVSDIGIGDIVSCYAAAMNSGGWFSIVSQNPETLSLFRMTMLHKILEIHDTVESALTSLTERKAPT